MSKHTNQKHPNSLNPFHARARKFKEVVQTIGNTTQIIENPLDMDSIRIKNVAKVAGFYYFHLLSSIKMTCLPKVTFTHSVLLL